jgi:hypothetical protein
VSEVPTFAQIANASELKVRGTAAVFGLRLESRTDTELFARRRRRRRALPLETLGTQAGFRHQLRKIIDGAVSRSFGGNYSVDVVDLVGADLRFTVTGADHLTPNVLSSANGGRVFEQKCTDTFKRSCAKLQALLDKRCSSSIRVAGDWAPGDGVNLVPTRTDRDAPEELIQARLDELRVTSRNLGRVQLIVFPIVAFTLLGGVAAYAFTQDLLILGTAAYVVLLGGIVGLPSAARHRGVDAEIRELADALELRDTADARERRALKLVQANSFALRRYYDQGLRQRTLVFGLGVVCILAGFGTVAASFAVLDSVSERSETTQIVVGVLGAVGAVLANYVAAIFLRMFAATIKASTDFHTRLVDTQHVNLGYLATAKIGEAAVRDQALAEMAVGLSGGEVPAAPRSADAAGSLA